MIRPRFLVAAAVVAALWGCGFYGQRADIRDVLAPQQPAPLLSDGTAKVHYDELFEYVVGNGDALIIEVGGHQEFSGPISVDQRGRIPLNNTRHYLDVTGLTLRQVEGRVAMSVAPYVVGRPEVHVSLAASRSKVYYVLGGVWAPGVYNMGGEVLRLREALAGAGLFREYRADTSRVGIITPDETTPTYVVVDARRVLMGVDEHNVVIKPGDVIFVQDKMIYDIDGFLYTLFRETENAATANKAVEFWEDATSGRFGDFAYPRSSVTVIY